jgi:hypothetical protein
LGETAKEPRRDRGDGDFSKIQMANFRFNIFPYGFGVSLFLWVKRTKVLYLKQVSEFAEERKH